MGYTGLEIAIIGMSCRFPGAGDINEFWRNTIENKESITFFDEETLLGRGVKPEALSKPEYVRAGGVISEKEYFDENFFGYSPIDAQMMLPQMRLSHKVVWEALEDAGISQKRSELDVGLYLGASSSTSWEVQSSLSEERQYFSGMSTTTVTSKDQIAARISYALDLKGPSMVIDTACSTSLVAIHLACQSLLAGECNIAVSGGISIFNDTDCGYLYTEGDIYSPDGHCRAFDEQARGTVRSEGIGVVVLKPLEDAIRDQDSIYAVIKGSAINNDGKGKVGYTAPSAKGQARVIRNALSASEVSPESIQYIEAHGTGTEIGDPIEIEGLKLVFPSDTEKYCKIGSVKSNIGHTVQAAGVASLIKTALCLKHRWIPGTVNFNELNPKIDLKGTPFTITADSSEWVCQDRRRAGVSSFGIGGTNAHIVMEEAPSVQEEKETAATKTLLPVSAKDSSCVTDYFKKLGEYLEQEDVGHYHNIAYTLQERRERFEYRGCISVCSEEDLKEQLKKAEDIKVVKAYHKPKVVFCFTGQGAQYYRMGYELYHEIPMFKQMFDECADYLYKLTEIDLKSIVFESSEEVFREKCLDGQFVQPLLYIFEYVLAQYLIRNGIKPDYLIGHSIGEFAAVCIADGISVQEGLELIVLRSRIMQQSREGAMLNLPLDLESVQKYLSEGISVAAINSERNVVLSGEKEAMDRLQSLLMEEKQEFRIVDPSHGYHSGLMDDSALQFQNKAIVVKFRELHIPMVSTVTGSILEKGKCLDSTYLSRHMRNTVLFHKSVETLLQQEKGSVIFLEIGPGMVLSNLIKQNRNHQNHVRAINTIRHKKELSDDVQYFNKKLGEMWSWGVQVDFTRFFMTGRAVNIPGYAFLKHMYGLEENIDAFYHKKLQTMAPALKKNSKNLMKDWFYSATWKRKQTNVRKEQVKKSYLVLYEDNDISNKMIDRLREANTIYAVLSGNGYEKRDAEHYMVNINKEKDYEAVLYDIKQQAKIDGIINLCCLSEYAYAVQEADDKMFDLAKSLGFYLLISAAKRTKDILCGDGFKLYNITEEVEEVTGEENLQSHFASALSPVLTIHQEYKEIQCKNIDINFRRGQRSEAFALQQLCDELSAEDDEVFVAYRGNYRYIRNYERVEFPEVIPKQTLKQKGTYILFGGLGYIGLTLAEYLMKHYEANVILAGQRLFPDFKKLEAWDRASEEERMQSLVSLYQKAQFENQILFEDAPFDAVSQERESRIQVYNSEFEADLESLSSYYILNFFKEFGVTISEGKSYQIDELYQETGMILEFKKLYLMFLSILEKQNKICRTDETIRFCMRESLPDITELYAAMTRAYPKFRGLMELLHYCVLRYKEVLTGKIPAVEVMFPEGNTDFIVNTLRKNGEIESNSIIVKETYKEYLQTILRSVDKNKPLRILEVGGGSGQLTDLTLDCIEKGQKVEYYFTDVSDNFIRDRKTRENPDCRHFINYRVFDISKEASLQGMDLHSFHLVIGYNVVHATRDINETLRNLKKLLLPHGRTILMEDVRVKGWIDMIYGLTSGWWAYEDTYRELSPIMPPENWVLALNAAGYTNIRTFPSAAEKLDVADTAIFVGESERVELLSEAAGEEKAYYDSHIQYIMDKWEQIKCRELPLKRLTVTKAKVEDYQSMEQLIQSAWNSHDKVDGIFYCAGMKDELKDVFHESIYYDTGREIFDAKTKGLRNLKEALKNREPDFVMVMSSLTGILAGLGLITYTASNMLADSLVRRFHSQGGTRWITANWYSWSNWLGSEESRNQTGQAIKELAMSCEEGWEAVEYVLNYKDDCQVIQYPSELKDMISWWVLRDKESERDAAAEGQKTAEQKDRGTAEERIHKIVSRIFGYDNFTLADSFFEIGGDSLKAVTVISLIEKEFEKKIPLSEFFKFSSLQQCADYINRNRIHTRDGILIERAAVKDYYVASSNQKRIFQVQNSNLQSTAYNETAAYYVKGEIDTEQLEDAFNKVIEKHECLRTNILLVDGEIVQKVNDEFKFSITYRKEKQGDDRRAINRCIKPFDLSKDLLVRGFVLEIKEDKILVIDTHHVVTDYISFKIFFKDLIDSYSGIDLKPCELQYKDYAEWMQSESMQEVLGEQKKYWMEEYKDSIERFMFKTNLAYTPSTEAIRDTLVHTFSQEETARIRAYAEDRQLTLYMLMFGTYSLMLCKLNSIPEAVIGTVVLGRSNHKLWDIMGMFVNTLAIRVKLDNCSTAREFYEYIKNKCLRSFENQDYPFEELLQLISDGANTGGISFFNTIFDLIVERKESDSGENMELMEAELTAIPLENREAKFDFMFSVREMDETISLKIGFDKNVFHRDSISEIVQSFLTILDAVMKNDSQPIEEIAPINQSVKEKVLKMSCSDSEFMLSDMTITECFKACAAAHSSVIAVRDNEDALTYEELDLQSSYYASKLLNITGGKKGHIGVLTDRKICSIVGIFAIMKAGCAYVPLSSSQSEARRNKIIEECGITAILVPEPAEYGNMPCPCVAVRSSVHEIMEEAETAVTLSPEDDAYVIFTSGTTGEPNGIKISHRNVMNLMAGLELEIYSHSVQTEQVALVADIQFDASVQQIFAALLFGHTLHIVDDETKADGSRLIDYFYDNGITISDSTPTHLNLINREGKSRLEKLPLHHYIIGGEKLKWSAVNRFYEKFANMETVLVNVYGPTECCVDNTFYKITRDTRIEDSAYDVVPIGRPLVNQRLYLLNEEGNLLPPGILGEIYIGGLGVSKGYLNRMELTENKFVTVPSISGDILYRTGDIGCWTEDGYLMCVDRKDEQVKINGYRIEPGAVEAVINSYEAIETAKIVLRKQATDGDKQMIAFYVSKEEVLESQLRTFMLQTLPHYMLPAAFIHLEKMPVNKSGKVDSNALTEMELTPVMQEKEKIQPDTPKERILLEIWKDIFGRTDITLTQNFFSLGGDSILALKLVSKVMRAGYTMNANDIYSYPTIVTLVEVMKVKQQRATGKDSQALFALTPIQQRFFELDKKEPGHFNQSVMLRLKKRFEPEVLREYFGILIKYHEALRMEFVKDKKNNYSQRYRSWSEELIRVTSIDLSETDNPYEEMRASVETETAFLQLEQELLMKWICYWTGTEQYLFLTIHHLIVDAVSFRILIGDLNRLMSGGHLTEANRTNSYSDWVFNLTSYSESDEFKRDREEWNQSIKPICLSELCQKGENTVKQNRTIVVEWNAADTKAVKEQVNTIFNTSMHETLLSVTAMSLQKHFMAENLLIDVETYGREYLMQDYDYSNTVGWFTAITPVYFALKKEAAPEEVIAEVKGRLRQLNKNGIAYGIHQYMCREPREPFTIPRSKISFNFLGELDSDRESDNFILDNQWMGSMIGEENENEYLLDVTGYIMEDKLHMSLRYNCDLFQDTSMIELQQTMEQTLKDLLAISGEKESSVVMPSDFDYKEISLDDFNQLFE